MRQRQTCLLVWSVVVIAGCTGPASAMLVATPPESFRPANSTNTPAPVSPVVVSEAVAPPPLPAQSIHGPTVEGDAGTPGNAEYGVPSVDAVLVAVQNGDAASIKQLIHYGSFGCTRRGGLGGPPACRPGETEGSLVEGIPLLDAEAVVARPDEQAPWINTLLARKPVLVGVYAQPAPLTREPDWLPADHAIVFVGGSPMVATALLMDGEGIVRVDTARSPAALLTRFGGILLSPVPAETQ